MPIEEEIVAKLNEMKDRSCHYEFIVLVDLIKECDPKSLDLMLNIIKKYDALSRKCFGLQAKLNNFGYRDEMQKWGIHETKRQR